MDRSRVTRTAPTRNGTGGRTPDPENSVGPALRCGLDAFDLGEVVFDYLALPSKL
jgi:hypothetical protein